MVNFYARQDLIGFGEYANWSINDLLAKQPYHIASWLVDRPDFALVSFSQNYIELMEEFPELSQFPDALYKQLNKVFQTH